MPRIVWCFPKTNNHFICLWFGLTILFFGWSSFNWILVSSVAGGETISKCSASTSKNWKFKTWLNVAQYFWKHGKLEAFCIYEYCFRPMILRWFKQNVLLMFSREHSFHLYVFIKERRLILQACYLVMKRCSLSFKYCISHLQTVRRLRFLIWLTINKFFFFMISVFFWVLIYSKNEISKSVILCYNLKISLRNKLPRLIFFSINIFISLINEAQKHQMSESPHRLGGYIYNIYNIGMRAGEQFWGFSFQTKVVKCNFPEYVSPFEFKMQRSLKLAEIYFQEWNMNNKV